MASTYGAISDYYECLHVFTYHMGWTVSEVEKLLPYEVEIFLLNFAKQKKEEDDKNNK